MAKQKTKAAATPAVKTFATTEANRKARLARHLKNHPNDAQAASAPATPAVRQKPKAKGAFPAAKTRLVIHTADGFVNAPVQLGNYTEAELFHRGSMSPKDYEARVRSMRRPTSELLKTNQGKFGKVSLNLFGVPFSFEDVKAVCHHLGLKAPRRK